MRMEADEAQQPDLVMSGSTMSGNAPPPRAPLSPLSPLDPAQSVLPYRVRTDSSPFKIARDTVS